MLKLWHHFCSLYLIFKTLAVLVPQHYKQLPFGEVSKNEQQIIKCTMYALLQSLWSFLSFQVSAKRGTIRSHPGVKFDPQKDAEVLRKAMKGIGMLNWCFLSCFCFCLKMKYEMFQGIL